MPRRVFFSFHFEDDVWRAGQVRNSNVVTGSDAAGFIDYADWESVKRGGDAAIKRWIDGQLTGTSVTVVLIGAETASREYVQYEIEKSIERGNGLVGVRIHNVKNASGQAGSYGIDPLPYPYATYDWVNDDGRSNMGRWIEAAARAAGR